MSTLTEAAVATKNGNRVSICSANCRRNAARQKIQIRKERGVRVCETDALSVAVAATLGRRADVTVFHAGSTDRAALEPLVDLLGGDRPSGPFERYRRIAFDPAKTHSIAESCAAHPFHTDGSFEAEAPAIFALHCEVADPTGGGINTFVSITQMLSEMPHALFEAARVAKVAFGRQDDSGRLDAYTGPMLYPRNGDWALRWRDDEQVGPLVVDALGTPVQKAIEWIRGFIKAADPVELFNHPGDIVLVNNDTVFHGRTPLSADSPRSVVRAWVQF